MDFGLHELLELGATGTLSLFVAVFLYRQRRLEDKVDFIKETVDAELTFNGGSSLKDKVLVLVERVDNHIDRNEADHKSLGRSVDHLRDEVRSLSDNRVKRDASLP